MMKVLYITAECKPFSKVGGVGDVAGALPPVLQTSGIDIEVVTPLYGSIDKKYIQKQTHSYNISFHQKTESVDIFQGNLSGVPVSFVKNPTYFEGPLYGNPYVHSPEIPFIDDILRFSFFSKACLPFIDQRQPDIIHINDWAHGYLFGWLAIEGYPQKRVLTIHNMGYQGNIWKPHIKDWDIETFLFDQKTASSFTDPRAAWHNVNALRLAMELSHQINTVSPTYCREITLPENPNAYFEGGKGLHEVADRLSKAHKLTGILNGYNYKNAASDDAFEDTLKQKARAKQHLTRNFTQSDACLLGFVGRAVEQKFKLLTEQLAGQSILEHLLDIPEVNMAILATGLPVYESFLRRIIAQGRDNFTCTIAFDKPLASQISLGSDIFLMPSLFEPCGMTQMESMSLATPPLVRYIGGLIDTVRPHHSAQGTGFCVYGDQKEDILSHLIETVKEAVDLFKKDKETFKKIQKNGFKERFTWENTAQNYINRLYKPALSVESLNP